MKQHFLKVWPYFLFFTAMLAALQFWPASYWLEVPSVNVQSGKDSLNLEMVIDRKVKRPFTGRWAITIRQWDGEWVVVCAANGGGGDFLEGAKLPKHVTLAMWTERQCLPLPPGKYTISKTWVIESLGLMPDKYVTQTSNQFEVTE